MNASMDLMQTLAWSLLHFLWQGAAIAAVAAAVMLVFRKPATRYLVGVSALGLMFLSFFVTFALLGAAPGLPAAATAAGAPAAALVPPEGIVASVTQPWVAGQAATDSRFDFAWVARGWLLGVFTLALRIAFGLYVLEQLRRRNLVALPGVGMSVLEISHRSKTFEGILAKTEQDLRALGNVPANYKVLFLQGGASMQFSMVPLNLLPPGATADYIMTGGWSQKAVKEAQRVGTVNIAASTESENFSRIPRQDELKLTPNAAYVHMTTNNTLFGTEWSSEPSVGDVPLVADTSSDMFSRPIDVSKYGLIYAGAQKNLGPSGVTLVIVREDLLARSQKSLHTMLNYAVHAENGSMYNTPPCFGIYLMDLVMKWALAEGGLEAIGRHNERKAAKLYAEIDRSGFYRGTADKASRSRMNITFRLPSEELEAKFVKETTAAGLDGLKGHRSVGGMRASIYNAFPEDGIDALVSFMQEFEKKNG